MWHLRTKQGTFWVVEEPKSHKYYLGVDDDELGVYDNAELAAKDVHDQVTGYPQWDCLSRIKAPENLANWAVGEPDHWNE